MHVGYCNWIYLENYCRYKNWYHLITASQYRVAANNEKAAKNSDVTLIKYFFGLIATLTEAAADRPIFADAFAKIY